MKTSIWPYVNEKIRGAAGDAKIPRIQTMTPQRPKRLLSPFWREIQSLPVQPANFSAIFRFQKAVYIYIYRTPVQYHD